MDEQTYLAAVERNEQRIFLLALSFLQHRQDAEDVLQTVFLKLWRHPVAFTDEPHIDKWLTKVAVNECRSLLRARKRAPLSYDELADFCAAPTREEDAALVSAVLALPPSLRTVIHLFYYEELSVKEIAGLLRLSQAAVKMRLARGRSRLKNVLTEEEDHGS